METKDIEWIKGPFANTLIEGFIFEESYGSVRFIVTHIEDKDKAPNNLSIGSLHNLPKRVLRKEFIVFNTDQQYNLIQLAKKLGQLEWAKELQLKFEI